jgi:CubicO group peptidase (beta-lactamase class C family)
MLRSRSRAPIYLLLLLLSVWSASGFAMARKVHRKVLQQIEERAQESKSDAILILDQGQNIFQEYSSGKPELIETQSAIKSIVNFAVGFLLQDGKLKSIDTPIYRFFPEWNTGRKKLVTLRHLLTQTSGIDSDGQYDNWPDVVKAALDAKILRKPGTGFDYTDRSVDLLSGVIQKIAGESTDRYLDHKLFKPLGIMNYRWHHDSAGHAYGGAGLEMTATDLAKIGEFMLNRGTWRGHRLLDAAWIRRSTEPSQKFEPRYGFLWWLIDWTRHKGFDAGGLFGQYLVIIPNTGIVAVRQYRERPNDDPDQMDTFEDFPDLVAQLAD